eukprot:94705-Pelagomonas_calceolata.AAC.2
MQDGLWVSAQLHYKHDTDTLRFKMDQKVCIFMHKEGAGINHPVFLFCPIGKAGFREGARGFTVDPPELRCKCIFWGLYWSGC